MSALDRRDFLRATAPLLLTSTFAEGASPPPKNPKAKGSEGLRPLPGGDDLPLPAGATRRLGTTRMRVPGRLNRLALAPNGTTLIGASGQELRGWDPRTGKVLFRLAYPADSSVSTGRLTTRDSFALIVRPNSGGHSSFCHYEFGSGKLIEKSPPLTYGQAQFEVFSIDGSLLLVVHEQGLTLFEAATGKEKWKESFNAGQSGGCAIFNDNSTIAVGYKGEVRLFAVATGKLISTLKLESPEPMKGKGAGGRVNDLVSACTPSPDGKWLAALAGDDGKSAFCWDVKSGKILHTFNPTAKIVGFHRGSDELATFHNGIVSFWNLSNGRSRSVEVPNDNDVELSVDGSFLACATEDAVLLIDSRTGHHLAHSADPPGLPDRLFFTHTHLTGRLSMWGGWIEWDLRTGNGRVIRGQKVAGKSPVAVSRNLKRGVYLSGPVIELHELSEDKVLARIKGDDRAVDIGSAALTPDGYTIVKWQAEKLVMVSAGDTKEQVVLRPGVVGASAGVFVAGHGRFAAVGFNNHNASGAVDVFDLTRPTFVRRFETTGDIGAISWTPDGNWLAVAHNAEAPEGRFGDQGTTTVFELASGKPVLRVPPDNHREHVIAISPNGRMLARMEPENKIAIWEVLSNSVRRRLNATGSVAAMAFSPDGRTLATSIAGAPIFLWDLHSFGWRIPPNSSSIETAWADLRSADATVAFNAMRLFTAHSSHVIPFLKAHATPVESPEAEQIRKWIDDLDHREFRKRETATKGLAGLGEKARGALRDALGRTLPTETRERIERLLAAEDKPTPDQLRVLRAVEVMEIIGTAEAESLLTHWGKGAAGALFTRASNEAVKRLAERPKS